MVEAQKETKNEHKTLKRVAFGVAAFASGTAFGATIFEVGSMMKTAAVNSAHSATTTMVSTIHSIGTVLPKQNVTYALTQIHLVAHDPHFYITPGNHTVTYASFLHGAQALGNVAEVAAIGAILFMATAAPLIAAKRHDIGKMLSGGLSAMSFGLKRK